MGLLGNVTQQDYLRNGEYGNYQFTSLEDVINSFMIVYIGEGKVIPKAKRVDVAFHAQRSLQELSFDTLKSVKAKEITIPPSLEMILPQDYVNSTNISWVDSSGIKHRIYPTLCKTSNPGVPPTVDIISAFGDVEARGKHIVLDGQYDDITYGMTVTARTQTTRLTSSPTAGIIVEQIITTNGITTVYINGMYGQEVDNVLFDFSLPTGEAIITDIVLPVNASFGHTTNEEDLIKPASGLTMDNFAKLEVNMLVVNQAFPHGTYITGLYPSDGTNPDTVHVSSPAGITLTNVANGVSGVVAFGGTTSDFGAGGTTEIVHFKYRDGITDWYQQNISTTASNYKSNTPSENNNDDYEDDTYWPANGERYGLDPQHSQVNGSFYIDQNSGKIHFSSNISGKTVILDYVSDNLGSDNEMRVHKFAEEAMYKSIMYAIISTMSNMRGDIIQRYKKEKFAEIRKAKLRLSNLKLEELTQVLRGKSKQIKH